MESNLRDGEPQSRPAPPEIDYRAIFRAGATPHAVVTTQLLIADANDAYLAMAGRSREEIVGGDLSQFFTADPAEAVGTDEAAKLRSSLIHTLRTGKPDVIHVERYPLFDTGSVSSQVRYFTTINIPVLDGHGEVAWILHRVEQVTEWVSASPASPSTETEAAAAALRLRTRDLVRRNNELALQASHSRTVSRILQEAMLTELPEPQHLQLASRYVANTETDQVGGDWYDAAVLPDGSTIVVVGDVLGHDITAAASMGQLRGLLRSVAWDREESPSAILERVERGMSGLKVDTFATVILGRIDANEIEGVRQIRWSNAGHPPPLVVSKEGEVRVLETRNDLPLGSGLVRPRTDHVHDLTSESVLILYTDGLVERRDRPLDDGIGRLADTLRRHYQLPLEDLLDRIVTEVAGSTPEDDVAVLAISIDPKDQPTRSPNPRQTLGGWRT
jgi:serine phosphatase RsbU (regulator of sigma subunit)